jgi:hypothetical protein
LFVRYGQTKDVPVWVNALLLAERGWGHPDDIMQRKRGALWAARQSALDQARKKSADMDNPPKGKKK